MLLAGEQTSELTSRRPYVEGFLDRASRGATEQTAARLVGKESLEMAGDGIDVVRRGKEPVLAVPHEVGHAANRRRDHGHRAGHGLGNDVRNTITIAVVGDVRSERKHIGSLELRDQLSLRTRTGKADISGEAQPVTEANAPVAQPAVAMAGAPELA